MQLWVGYHSFDKPPAKSPAKYKKPISLQNYSLCEVVTANSVALKFISEHLLYNEKPFIGIKRDKVLGLVERRKRERENRKNAILRAARKLFFENGFRTVTIDSIAKKAELSKGSIYLYFKSKEEIYTQILLSDIDKFHEHFTDLLQNPTSASEAIIRFAGIYVDLFLNDRELFRILMTFMLHTTAMNLPEELNNHIIKSTNKNISVIEEIFRYGIERGEFPPTINLRLSRNALWGLLNGIISLHLFTGVESKRADVIRSTIKAGLETYITGLKNREQQY